MASLSLRLAAASAMMRAVFSSTTRRLPTLLSIPQSSKGISKGPAWCAMFLLGPLSCSPRSRPIDLCQTKLARRGSPSICATRTHGCRTEWERTAGSCSSAQRLQHSKLTGKKGRWVHRFLSTSTVRSFRSGPGLDQNSRRKRTISLASRRPEQCGCWRKSSRAGAVACAPRFNSTDMMRWILPVPSVAQLAKNAIPCSLAQQHAPVAAATTAEYCYVLALGCWRHRWLSGLSLLHSRHAERRRLCSHTPAPPQNWH